MGRARSAWRADAYAPSGELIDIPEPSFVLFGCRPFEAGRDLTMGRPDSTGLRRPSEERKQDDCPRCGGDPAKRAYCECCSRVESAANERIESMKLADRLKADAAESAKRKKSLADRIAKAREKRRASAGAI
jgi:hypothetical protein